MASLRPFTSSLSTFLLKPQTLTNHLRHSSAAAAVAGGGGGGGGGQVALYLRRARLIDSLRLRLRSHDPSSPFPLPSSSLDPFVAAHALRSAPSPESALSLFRSLSSLPFLSNHPSLLQPLARRLSRSRRLPDLHSVISALDASPLPPSPMDRLSWLAAAGDLPSSLHLWSSIRSAASLSHLRHPCTESYNLIMGLFVDSRSDGRAISTFSRMIEEGANPNSRTYTVIIDHLVRSGNLAPAMEVFALLPSMRIRRTSKQFNVIAEALVSAGRIDDIRNLLDEMRSDGILPGPPVRAAIVKLRSAGYVDGTNEFVKELSPDERIGYAVESGSDDEGDGSRHDSAGDRIQVKPWIDPTALARALDGWDPMEVSALEAARFVWTSRLVCKLLRGFKKPETAWAFFCWVAYQSCGFNHDCQTVSRMIAILARHGHVELVDRLLSKVRAEGIVLPFATIRLVIDFYGPSKRADAAIKVFREASTVCGAMSRAQQLLLYSSLLRTVLKCGRGDEAMDTLEEMMMEGILPDAQIFSGLMEFFAGEGDLKSVHKVFVMVRQCGIEPDGYMCQVLIRAYCKQERAALALRVFDEMRSSNLMPDLATKTLLVKSLWKEGKLREAALVEERCEEVEAELPAASPGHVWTVSKADFKRVYDIYSGCFQSRSYLEREDLGSGSQLKDATSAGWR